MIALLFFQRPNIVTLFPTSFDETMEVELDETHLYPPPCFGKLLIVHPPLFLCAVTLISLWLLLLNQYTIDPIHRILGDASFTCKPIAHQNGELVTVVMLAFQKDFATVETKGHYLFFLHL